MKFKNKTGIFRTQYLGVLLNQVEKGYRWAGCSSDGQVWLFATKPLVDIESGFWVPAYGKWTSYPLEVVFEDNENWVDTLQEIHDMDLPPHLTVVDTEQTQD